MSSTSERTTTTTTTATKKSFPPPPPHPHVNAVASTAVAGVGLISAAPPPVVMGPPTLDSFPGGAVSALGVWTLGLGLLGDSELLFPSLD